MWNVRRGFWDILNEASLDVLDIFSNFVDCVADEEVEVGLPHGNNPSGHRTPIEAGTSYVEDGHYARQLFLPASDTILIRLRA